MCECLTLAEQASSWQRCPERPGRRGGQGRREPTDTRMEAASRREPQQSPGPLGWVSSAMILRGLWDCRVVRWSGIALQALAEAS